MLIKIKENKTIEKKVLNPHKKIYKLQDEYGDPYFYDQEFSILEKNNITCVYQLFQLKRTPDPKALHILNLLKGVQIGENSRAHRLELLRSTCEIDPARFEADPRRPSIDYNKLPSTHSPSGDGYLPRRARGVLTGFASEIFDGTKEARDAFDNHHRGGGYDRDDDGSWKFD